MATLRRRNLRSPGQSARYRDHPSNVGSSSYYADTGRGWVPNPGVNRNRQALNNVAANRAKRIRQPTFGGDQGRGGQGNVYRAPTRHHPSYTTHRGKISGAPGGIGRGITGSAPGREYIEKVTEEEIDKATPTGAYDHSALAHLGPFLKSLPMPKVMGMAGDTISDAARGSRLYDYYKDSAVAAGETKAQGRKDYEADKKFMVPGWDLKRGDAGYEGSDKHFYDKYMDLASMEDDATRRAELEATAKSAWSNKQTSDRLAAFNRFEDYNPGKYSGLGEGSRYTGSHRKAGKLVPGVGIMDDILDRYYQGQGPGTDTRANQNFVDVKNAMEEMGGLSMFPDDEFILGDDVLFDQYPDEPGMMHTAEDLALLEDEDDFILGDTLYDQYPDEPTGFYMKPENRKIPFNMLPNIGYYGGKDEPDRAGTFTGPFGYKPKHRNLGLDTGYGAEEIFEEEEIVPDILNPDYFNQFR